MDTVFWLENPKELLINWNTFAHPGNHNRAKLYNWFSKIVMWGALFFAIVPFGLATDHVFLVAILILTVTAILYFGAPSAVEPFDLASNVLDDPFSSKTCTMPTEQNPFMNLSLANYGTGKIQAPACRGPLVDAEAERMFQKRGPQDKRDLYGRKVNNSRAWVTMPRTGTLDGRSFYQNWLFGGIHDCKINPSHCVERNSRSDPQLRVI